MVIFLKFFLSLFLFVFQFFLSFAKAYSFKRSSTISLTFFCFSVFSLYLGEAISKNPGYLKLRKIRAAQAIAKTVNIYSIVLFRFSHFFFLFQQMSASQNRVYLDAQSLMLNIADKDFDISKNYKK